MVMLSSKCLALVVGIATIVMVAAKFGDRVDPNASRQSATPAPSSSGLTQATRPRDYSAERPTTPRGPVATTTPRVAAIFNREITGAASEQRSTSPLPNTPPPGFDNNFPPSFGFKDPSFDYNYGPPAPTAATDNQYQHQSYGPNGPSGPNGPPNEPQGPPPPPPQPNYDHNGGYREPEFMRSLLEQFDKVASAERNRKAQSSTSSVPRSSSSNNYNDASRSPLPPLPSASSHTSAPPVYRSTSPVGASSSSYYGPSATTVGGNSVPNYGPSSMSDTFGPTSSYGPSNSYSSNVDHNMPTSPEPDHRRKSGGSAYYNQIPQPQGSGTHYNQQGPNSYPPPSEPSSYGPPPPPPPPQHVHHTHGPRLNHGNDNNHNHQHNNHNHQDQGSGDHGQHDHSRDEGPGWPTGLPDPSKDPRAKMEEESVGGENKEGKPWGHKKKYVYRDPKNGNNYMEISEVHMSVNKQYQPGENVQESASHLDKMVDMSRRFREPPRSFFDGLNFDSSDMNPFVAPRPPF